MSIFTIVVSVSPSVSEAEAVSIVRKLPREISLYIYREFLETECKYEIIMREFRSERVKRLYTIDLCDLMNQHYSDAKVISYLRKREESFNHYYVRTITLGIKDFTLMTPHNSITNCWVYINYK